MQTRFQAARSIILQAGALAKKYFGDLASLTVRSKGSHDLVSEADLKTEALIRENLAERFPDDGFFGEESGASEPNLDGGLWVVDPIDGTQGFLSGLPNWCVSIGYVLGGALEFGLVYDPCCNELFSGGRGFPAVVNDRPIAVHVGADLSAGLVSIGFSPRSSHSFLFHSLTRLLEEKGMFYRNGSGALSLAYVAAGRLLGSVEPHMHAWDCFGAVPIILAAGGQVNEIAVREALVKGTRIVAGPAAVYAKLEGMLE